MIVTDKSMYKTYPSRSKENVKAITLLLLSRMRRKLLVECAFPELHILRRMQQDCISEENLDPDEHFDFGAATSVRNNIYLKMKVLMGKQSLHDTMTRKALVWDNPSVEEKEEVGLIIYLKFANIF